MFIDSIDLYPDKKKPGNLVQMVHFRFPVSYNGEAVYDYSPPEKSNDETVVLLSKKRLDSCKSIDSQKKGNPNRCTV